MFEVRPLTNQTWADLEALFELRGGSIVRGCWCGDAAQGQALIDEWRAWRTPAVDMFGPMPFHLSDTISNDPVDPIPAMVSTEWFDDLPDAAIDVLVEATAPTGEGPPQLLFTELRHAGGAIRRNAPPASNSRRCSAGSTAAPPTSGRSRSTPATRTSCSRAGRSWCPTTGARPVTVGPTPRRWPAATM